MARHLFVLEEVIAMLQVLGAAKGTIENFRRQAEAVSQKRPKHAVDDMVDDITVASGYGHTSQRGFVEFTLNDQLSQMEPNKAREIGYMLIEAAEAATSDEMFVTLLKRVGIEDAERLGRMLIDLREIRQGTRGIARPS